MKNKILKLTVAMAAVILLTAALVVAVTAEVYTGSCGENVTYTLDTETGVLEIEGTGEMTDYSNSSGVPWYSLSANIKSVTIANGITSIGECAFYNCSSLTSVDIGNSVTSIGWGAFHECNSLTSIEIPDSVTSIGNWAFSYCVSLTSVTIPDSVTNIGSFAFYVCENLTNVTIGESVASIGCSAFSCTGLTDITFPDNVTSIGESALAYCYNLTSVVIGEGVTSIGDSAFSACHSLTTIDVKDDNTVYCDIDGILFSKDKKTLVAYPIGGATTYSIPDSVTIIGNGAFAYFESLTSVVIPNKVTDIGKKAFWGCSNLKSITIPDGVTNIGEDAFYHCRKLTSIKIPNSVTVIGDDAFDNCIALASVVFETKNAFIDANAFNNCTNLKTIYLYKDSTADEFFSSDEYTKIYLDDGYVPTTNKGDVYLDGVVDMKDLVLLGDYLAARIDEIDFNIADVNSDGEINAIDAVLIFRYIPDCYQYHDPGVNEDFSLFAPRGELFVPEKSDDPDVPKLVLNGKQTGNVFVVTVSAVNNPGVRGMLFELTYDSRQLTLTNIDYNGKFEQTSCYDPEDPPEEYLCTHPISFLSYQNSKDISGDGVWATLTFEVADDFYLYGNIDYYTIFFSKFDSTNADFERVEFACESQIEYTITYVSSVDAPEAQTKKYGETIILPNITTEVKNRKFMGWSLSENSDYASYAPGDEFTLNRSVTLYAVWKDTVQYYFDEETGYLYIYGEGEIYKWKVEELCTADTLKSLYIDDGITSIPGNCFNGYSNLAEIYIPNSVEFIGELVFDGTAYYKNESNWDEDGVLYINNHLVAAKTTLSGEYRIRENTRSLSNSAFCDCRELKDVYIPGTVKTIYPGSFVGCYGLRKIIFGEGVETIKKNVFMMSGPKNLSLIVIPKSVTMIEDEGNSFYEENFAFFSTPTIYVHQDSNLSHNFGDAEIVYYLDSGDCGNDVTWEFDFVTGLLKFTGSSAIVVQGNSWRSLTDFITRVDIDIRITEIGSSAFKDCTKLEYVYFCYKDETDQYWQDYSFMDESNLVSIGNDAFNNCTSLHWLGDFPSTLKTIGDRAFKNYRSEQDYFDNFGWIESIGKEAFYGCRNVGYIDLINCTTVGDGAFFDSSAFRVVIGEKMTQIGKSAFAWCYQLDGFDVDYNNPNYSSYAGYLYNKDATELICVPAHMYVSDILDSVTKIHDCALAQSNIISLTLPENAKITSDMVFQTFAVDTGYVAPYFETVFISKNYVSKTVLEKLKELELIIGDIVYYDETYSGSCGDNLTWTLTDIQYGGHLSIEGSGDMYDFYEEPAPWWRYRHGITYVDFNGEITSIGAMAFADHWRIDSVYFPPVLESIGEFAFGNCMNLEYVSLEYSNIKHIGTQAFFGTNLSNVILGDSLESIGDCAFSSINGLKILYISESVKEIGGCIVCGNEESLDAILLHKGSYADEYFSEDEIFSSKVVYVDEAYGECSETISWKFDWDSGKLTLSGSGAFDGYDYYTEEAPWRFFADFIRDIVIEEGIIHVGDFGINALTGITVWFPKSVTSMDEYLINSGLHAYVYTTSFAAKCFPDHRATYFDGKCGKNLKFFYDYMEDILTISGNGEMYDYGYWAAPWTVFDPSTVFISEGVTSIGDFAFIHSSRLEKLYVPKSVTKLPNPEYEDHFGYDNDYSVFCIYLHEGSYADEYFKENYDYTIKYLSVLEDENDVSIIGEAGVDYPENTEIIVEVVDDEMGDIVIEGHSDKICALDITLVSNGVETQPNSTIFVRIKVPEGFNGKKCKVYHRTDDGQLVDMEAVYEDGYLVFATDHFSIYVVAEILAADSGDLNGDGDINSIDAVLLAQYIADWDVELDETAADCNGDGEINSIDAVLLAQYIAGWDVTLG